MKTAMNGRFGRVLFGSAAGVAVALASLGGVCVAGEALGAEAWSLAVEPPAAKGRDVVMTTFYPTYYFAKRIAMGKVGVECPLPGDEDAIFWKPSAEVIGSYQSAGLIVVNGASFEKWVDGASLPLSRVVNTARVFESEFVKFKTTTHSHGAAGTHTHTGVDGHTWQDPNNAIRQAEQIMLGLARRWPEHEKTFREGYEGLQKDLKGLDERLKGVTAKMSGVVMLANHPAYNYLAKRYGWTVKNLDVSPDETLDEEQWKEVGKEAAGLGKPGTRVMLFESEPQAATRERLLKEWGVEAVVWSPCESLPEEAKKAGGDYLSVMNENMNRLQDAFSGKASKAQPADGAR